MNRNFQQVSLVLLVFLLLLSGCERETETSETLSTAPPQVNATSPPQATSTLAATDTPMPTLTPTPEIPEGVIADVIHLVDAHTQVGGDWEEALVDMLLYAGGEVWAKEESTALIGVGEEHMTGGEPNFVRVAPNTIFTLERPDQKTVQLNLQEGQVWINIEGLSSDESFQVQTSTAVASVEGTRFSVRVDEDGRTIVSTVVNTVTVSTTEGAVQVGQKNQTVVQAGEAPNEPERISDVDFIRWILAAGDHLDVIAPLGDLVDTYSLNGYAHEGIWSADGSTFSFTYHLPDMEGQNTFWEHYDVTNSTLITTTNIPSDTYSISYNPAGDGVTWTQGGVGGMKICTAQSHVGEPTCFGSPYSSYYVGEAVWSPDGEWLLYQLNSTSPDVVNELYVSRPDGSENTQLTFYESGYTGRYSWSPDGTQIAYAYTENDDWNSLGQAWVVNADGSDPKMVSESLQQPHSSTPLSWNPIGPWLAIESQEGLLLVDPNESKGQLIHPSDGGFFFNIQWSPTSNGWPLLYSFFSPEESSSIGGNYFILDESGEPRDYNIGAWGPVYSPDGDIAAFGATTPISEEPRVYESTIYFFEILPWWP